MLKECDAGIKMGISSISDVLPQVRNSSLKQYLTDCKAEHEQMQDDIQQLLNNHNDGGKDPNPIAASMSWMKTNVKIGLDNSDQTIADLITDGCNMGVKSLNRHLNQYAAADKSSKSIAKRLIQSEEQLSVNIREFL